MKRFLILFALLIINCQLSIFNSLFACTNLIVGKKASKDGSVIISYSQDDYGSFEPLRVIPAADHPAGTMHPLYHYESGNYLGEIPEVAHTYGIVGLMNEFQLSIHETTYGGREELTGGEPVITQANGGMMVRWPLSEVDGEIILQLKEDRFIATCTNKSIEWCMLLYVHPEALLPSFTIRDKTMTAVRGKYPYQLTLRSGVFEDLRNHRGLAYGILPKNGKVDMLMRSTNKNLERAKAE